MGIAVEPKTRANALLAQGVRKSEPELVRQALAAGASPDVYMTSWFTSALALAFRYGNEEVIALLAEAGADPLFTISNGASIGRPIHESSVRHHPIWGTHFLAKSAPKIASLRTSHLGNLLRMVAGPHENDQAWMELVRLHGDKDYTPTNWWCDAFQSGSIELARYARKHFTRIAPARFVRLVETTSGNLQSGLALVEVIKGYPVADQVTMLLDVRIKETSSVVDSPLTGSTKGLLEWSTLKLDAVAAAVWDYALAMPEVLQAIGEQGRAEDLAFMSMRLDTPQILLGMSLLSEQDIAGATYEGKSLIDVHLARPDGSPSVKVLRALVKKGCQPTTDSLAALCRCMTYSTPERKLTPLFREWVRKGVDPNPEGGVPVWNSVRNDEKNGIASRLEAWHRSFLLDKRLQQTTSIASPSRPRM